MYPSVQVAPRGAGNFDSVDDSRVIPASVVKKLKTLPQADQVDGGSSVQGVYVLDKDHGWMEIHPVWRITVPSH